MSDKTHVTIDKFTFNIIMDHLLRYGYALEGRPIQQSEHVLTHLILLLKELSELSEHAQRANKAIGRLEEQNKADLAKLKAKYYVDRMWENG